MQATAQACPRPDALCFLFAASPRHNQLVNRSPGLTGLSDYPVSPLSVLICALPPIAILLSGRVPLPQKPQPLSSAEIADTQLPTAVDHWAYSAKALLSWL